MKRQYIAQITEYLLALLCRVDAVNQNSLKGCRRYIEYYRVWIVVTQTLYDVLYEGVNTLFCKEEFSMFFYM